jgi:hypothetical protein
VGPAVYLLYQPDGDASAWRSEILAARFEYDVDTLRAWGQAKMPASLIIEREAVREGALVQIPLTNTNGTNNTAGPLQKKWGLRPVLNHPMSVKEIP